MSKLRPLPHQLGPIESAPIFSETPASDEFAFLVCNEGSTCDTTCELCGRVFFHDTSVNLEDGQLEEYFAKNKQDPLKYIGVSEEPHWGIINGLQAVLHCPCNGLRLYEEFIWDNRKLICHFLTETAKKRLKAASSDHRAAEAASEAIESTEQ